MYVTTPLPPPPSSPLPPPATTTTIMKIELPQQHRIFSIFSNHIIMLPAVTALSPSHGTMGFFTAVLTLSRFHLI
jgi:hypothetical protein